MNNSNFHEITQQTFPLHQRRTEIELDLLRVVFADPPTLWPTATAEGLSVDHFDAPDAKAMADGIALRYADGRMAALGAAATALIDAGLWDDAWPPADTRETCWWSPRRLISWSRRYYVDPEPDMSALVAVAAAALIELAERIDRAGKLAAEYFTLIGADISEGRAA